MDPRSTLQVQEFSPFDESDRINELGSWIHENSHYKMRNDRPYRLPDYASVLRPLGRNGLNLLQEKWRRQTNDANLLLKDANIIQELKYWVTFRQAASQMGQVPILDVGVCYAAALPTRVPDKRGITRMCLLDYLTFAMEDNVVKKAAEGDVIAALFNNSGLPSEGGAFLRRDLASRLLFGSSGKVSTCHRLVVKDNEAWLADVDESSEFRRPSLCEHTYKLATLHDSEQNIFLPEEIMMANRVVWLMRGMFCDQATFNNPVTNFAAVKNAWLSIRVLKRLRDHLKQRGVTVPFELSPSRVFKLLKCGVAAADLLMACRRTITGEKHLLVSQLRDLVSMSTVGNGPLLDCVDTCNSLEALDLILWLHMLHCARRCLELDAFEGIVPVDPETPYLYNNEEEAVDFGGEDIDEAWSKILEMALGMSDSNNMRALKYVQQQSAPPTLASNLRGAPQLQPNEIEGLVFGIPGKTWLLDERCVPRMPLTRVSDGAKRVFNVVRSADIISYNPVNARKIERALRGIKGFTAFGGSISFDYAKKADERLFKQNVQTVNCFNELVRGDYGEEGLKYALNLVFRGGLKIKQGAGFPTCYLPGYAKQADGLTVTEFANNDIMSRATYIWRDRKLVWLPGHGLNAFVVEHDIRSKTVHMTEITNSINASCHKTGAATITFDVGCAEPKRKPL